MILLFTSIKFRRGPKGLKVSTWNCQIDSLISYFRIQNQVWEWKGQFRSLISIHDIQSETVMFWGFFVHDSRIRVKVWPSNRSKWTNSYVLNCGQMCKRLYSVFRRCLSDKLSFETQFYWPNLLHISFLSKQL